ncbi:MAG: hypothetical protein M3N51_06370 [Actinomycetota bacterium]|nr:hypothetical protein [Actinomycetota bacterium]
MDGLVAGAVGGVISGVPSTLHALVRRGRPIEATLAAGSLLLPRENRLLPLVLAALPVHLAVSLGWGVVLSAGLPGKATAAWGALAGLGIAAFDLGVVGRRFPRLRELTLGPQLVDHLLYGWAVGAVLASRRESDGRRGTTTRPAPSAMTDTSAW